MSMEPTIPRLVPEVPLPSYAYVPGSGQPHPRSDPAGYGLGARPSGTTRIDPDRWPECRPYLHGFDLFNRGFYWETHEVWEPLWLAHDRKGPVADFLKGLIKLAAAGVKHRQGVAGGMATHARRAADLLRDLDRARGMDPAPFLGLRLRDLIDLSTSIARRGWPDDAVILLPEIPGDRP